jgi:hypothetical protein
MEIGDMTHLGSDIIVQMLMLYATSPLARESYEKLMTGDPFNIDITLPDNAANRSAEIVETYLKTIGKRIIFRKVKKEPTPSIEFNPIRYYDKGETNPIVFFDKEVGSWTNDYIVKMREENKGVKYPIVFHPICYTMPVDEAITLMKQNEEKRLKALNEAIENGEVDFEK